ncbi:hypothetical protein NXC14_PA00342 (plasmid) [Rhizobium sp. NXC14]|nr:hypothetical protein NXC14_PA00342 [Rhizobium sp. NXC14]
MLLNCRCGMLVATAAVDMILKPLKECSLIIACDQPVQMNQRRKINACHAYCTPAHTTGSSTWAE